MAKHTIIRWCHVLLWAGILGIAVTLIANAADPGRFPHELMWQSLALEALGFAVAVGSVIAVTVAWWRAMYKTHQLADQIWFELLLWSGIVAAVTRALFSIGALIGYGIMIAYLRIRPDGMSVQLPQIPHRPHRRRRPGAPNLRRPHL